MNVKTDRQPHITGHIELNQKFGYGFQGRLILGKGAETAENVLDNEPYELAEAYAGMYQALEDIKKERRYKYKTHKIIHIDGAAIEVNKSRDFTCAQLAADIQEGKGELTVPLDEDYRVETIDGEEQHLLSARGTLLLTFFSWRDEKPQKAKEALYRYCEYLAAHRYGKGASDIFDELESKDNNKGADWIKATYSRFVKDDFDIMRHVIQV